MSLPYRSNGFEPPFVVVVDSDCVLNSWLRMMAAAAVVGAVGVAHNYLDYMIAGEHGYLPLHDCCYFPPYALE